MNATMMIEEAQRMSREMLSKEYRGPGDTLESAAYRLQIKRGVPASTTLRLWNREVTDMLVSSFAPVFNAYLAFKDKVTDAADRMEEAYEEERNQAVHPRLLRLADFVAGRKAQQEKE